MAVEVKIIRAGRKLKVKPSTVEIGKGEELTFRSYKTEANISDAIEHEKSIVLLKDEEKNYKESCYLFIVYNTHPSLIRFMDTLEDIRIT